jgi:hypothetical protein
VATHPAHSRISGLYAARTWLQRVLLPCLFSPGFFLFFFFFLKEANTPSFNAAQLSRLHDLKCFSLTHFNLVNMLQQVANFSEMASPRHLHIKGVVGGAGPLLGCGGRRQPSLFLQVGCLGLALGRQRQCAGPGGREHPPPHRPPLALVRTFPEEGAPLGYHLRARVGGGAHLSSSAFIKSRLEMDGRGYWRRNHRAQLSNLLALNSE